jgi:hypothetical protein
MLVAHSDGHRAGASWRPLILTSSAVVPVLDAVYIVWVVARLALSLLACS